MDEEDFLAAVEADNADVPVEDPKEATPEGPKQEEPAEPVQDQPIEAPTLAEPATPTEPSLTVEAPKESREVPITALLDERDKRKAAEAQLAQLQTHFQQTQQQPQIPDPIEDPEGFAHYQQQATQAAVLTTKLDISEEMARAAHGDEIVSEVQQWALQQYQINPGFRDEVLRQRHPYGFAIQQYQRQRALEKLGDPTDIDAFLAWKQAQAGLQQAATAPPGNGAAPPNQAPAIPPRSLAGAPSAGGINTPVPITEEDIFEGAIPKKA